jgi:predicted HTH transcriptional regulator
LEKARDARGLEISLRTPAKEALERLDLIKNGKLMNTAILLFRKKSQKFFIQSTIIAAK